MGKKTKVYIKFSPVESSGIVTRPYINFLWRFTIQIREVEFHFVKMTMNKLSGSKHLIHSSHIQLAVTCFLKCLVIFGKEGAASMA